MYLLCAYTVGIWSHFQKACCTCSTLNIFRLFIISTYSKILPILLEPFRVFPKIHQVNVFQSPPQSMLLIFGTLESK